MRWSAAARFRDKQATDDFDELVSFAIDIKRTAIREVINICAFRASPCFPRGLCE